MGLIAAAGVDLLILREKDLTPTAYQALAAPIRDLCARTGTPLAVNTFAAVAAALGIGTVTLSADSFLRAERPAGAVRVGVSVHGLAEGLACADQGADFLIYGNIFPTSCKPGLPGRGRDELRQLCTASDIPVYAIGGITPANAQTVHDCGADGVCLMSGFMQAEDPAALVQALRAVRA